MTIVMGARETRRWFADLLGWAGLAALTMASTSIFVMS